MPKNFRDRDLVYVILGPATGNLRYGFSTGLRSSLRGQFGQIAIVGTSNVQNLVIGANAPKPARASKLLASGYEGSYCAHGNRGRLKQSGYKITRPKVRLPGAGRFSDPVYVTINGIKYAWNIPNDAGLNRAGLGIKAAGRDDSDLVWGASFPKPAIAAVQSGANLADRHSSFVDPTNEGNLPANYAIVKTRDSVNRF